MTTVVETRQANQALLDTAARMVDEFDDVPAGRVLRSFSRAVGQLRRDGCPTPRLAAEAEWLTREALAGRSVIEPLPESAAVPAPRGARQAHSL